MVNSPFTVCPSLTQSSRRQRECAVHYVDSPRNLLICNIFSVPIIDIMSSKLDNALVGSLPGRCGCSRRPSIWLHPRDRDKNRYRKYGKGHTLSSWWSLCQACEDAYQSGDDERAFARMMLYDSQWNIGWHIAQRTGTTFDLDESVGKALRVFRNADLGAKRLN
jgi:hypothetical protein